MWLFTRYGFITAVAARHGNGEPWQPLDPDRIAIRTRTRQQLENLIARFPDDLGDSPIWDDAQADYRLPHLRREAGVGKDRCRACVGD